MRPFLPIFSFLTLAVSATPAAAQIEGIYFEHRDWVVACDNTRTCRAAGYQAEDYAAETPAPPVSLLLTRKAGAGEPVGAELSVVPEDGQDPMAGALTLRINGRDRGKADVNRENGTATLSRAQTGALLDALSRDSEIEAVADDGQRWVLSDDGASAVLLKMDEFQGRLNTPGALARRGDRNEAEVLPAVPALAVHIPELVVTRPGDARLSTSAALRAALRATAFGEDESCDILLSDEKQPLTVERVSDDKLLVSTPCQSGAYNQSIGFWTVDEGAPDRPQLVTTSASGFEKGRIWAAHKGRGLGDCWFTAAWSWDGERFVQTEEATTGLCRGFAGGAWRMPTLVSDVQPDPGRPQPHRSFD